MRRLALLLLLIAPAARAAGCHDNAIPRAYQLGVTLGVLVNGTLPDFVNGVTAYGLSGSVPVGDDSIDFLAQYASAPKFTATLVEASYRYQLPTPFFRLFLLGGIHFLNYTQTATHAGIGANVGIGYLFPFSPGFHITFHAKGYFREQPLLSFGGGVSFLL